MREKDLFDLRISFNKLNSIGKNLLTGYGVYFDWVSIRGSCKREHIVSLWQQGLVTLVFKNTFENIVKMSLICLTLKTNWSNGSKDNKNRLGVLALFPHKYIWLTNNGYDSHLYKSSMPKIQINADGLLNSVWVSKKEKEIKKAVGLE